jgi:hypothetical protein
MFVRFERKWKERKKNWYQIERLSLILPEIGSQGRIE